MTARLIDEVRGNTGDTHATEASKLEVTPRAASEGNRAIPIPI